MKEKQIGNVLADFDFLIEGGYSVEEALRAVTYVYDYQDGE